MTCVFPRDFARESSMLYLNPTEMIETEFIRLITMNFIGSCLALSGRADETLAGSALQIATDNFKTYAVVRKSSKIY